MWNDIKGMFGASEGSPPLFKNRFIDSFSRVHWILVPLVWVPVTLWSAWRALFVSEIGLAAFLIFAVAGFVAWGLTEYWLHRTVFHWVPEMKWGKDFHFIVHGLHHDYPNDRYRLVMPPSLSVPLGLLFFSISLAIFGGFGWAFMAGFVPGYMSYDLTHYYLHHGRPKHPFLVALKKHHMVHHFAEPELRFGVSLMIWDRVFDTMPRGQKKAQKKTKAARAA